MAIYDCMAKVYFFIFFDIQYTGKRKPDESIIAEWNNDQIVTK